MHLAPSELLFLLSRLEDLERAEQALVNAHHGSRIVEFTTVIGRAEQCHQLTLGEELVAVFDDLVGTTDEIHVVLLQESRHHIGPKGKRDTSVVLTPAGNVLVGIRPEQVAKQTTIGNISGPHDASNLLHGVQIRAQTTVHGEDLLVDDSGDRKAIEAVGEGLPQLDVVAALALVVEAVDTVDGRTLVVATQNEEVFGVLDLVGKQKADSLERLLASVNVITQEEVVGFGREATVLKEPQQIIILAVDVAADLDGSLELEQDGLRDEDFAGFGAQVPNLGLEQLDLLSGSAAPHFEKAIDYRIEVDLMLVSHSR